MAADAQTVFVARALTKVYRLGEVQVHALRGVDLEIRSGEFVVLLGHTERENAGKVMERFRKVVEAYRFPQLEGVTISIGFTCARGISGSTAFERADEALYIAKKSGRNQVRCFETLIEEGVLKHKVAAESEVELF